MNKAQVLDQAKALLGGDRQDDYGDARENHERIARLWAEVLGVKVEAWQVAVCMGMVKVSRAVQSPDKADTWVDMAAYAAIGAEVAGVVVDEVRDVLLDAVPVFPRAFIDAVPVAPVIEEGKRAQRLGDGERTDYARLGEIDGGMIVVDRFGVHHERITTRRGDVWHADGAAIAPPGSGQRAVYDSAHGPYKAVARKVRA